MAYTGTGTQADPYIVNNWADFKALCGTTGVYIAFDPDAENKVIDINDTDDRGGLQSTLLLYANVEGNDWEIRNLYTKKCFIQGYGNTIQNLHFLNLVSDSDYIFNYRFTMTGCRFSVLFLNVPSFGYVSGTTPNYVDGCSFHFHFLHTASGSLFRRYWFLSNCNLELHGNIGDLVMFDMGNMSNCSLSGELELRDSTLSLKGGSKYNAVTAKIGGTGTLSATDAASKACILDKELVADTVTQTITGTNWYALTTAQMQDADYLMNTVGFPCVVSP
jgi:hypothetical protein